MRWLTTPLSVATRPMTRGEASKALAATAGSITALDPHAWNAQILEGGIWGGGYGPTVVLVAVPAAMISGAMYGTMLGSSKNDVDAATAAIAAASADLHFEQDFARAMLTTTARRGSNNPLTFGASAEAPASTRLRLVVYYCGLYGGMGVNPSLKLCIVMSGTLTRVREATEAGQVFVGFTSTSRSYTQWADGHGRALREEWAKANDVLAQQIVGWLAGAMPPAPRSPPGTGSGSE